MDIEIAVAIQRAKIDEQIYGGIPMDKKAMKLAGQIVSCFKKIRKEHYNDFDYEEYEIPQKATDWELVRCFYYPLITFFLKGIGTYPNRVYLSITPDVELATDFSSKIYEDIDNDEDSNDVCSREIGSYRNVKCRNDKTKLVLCKECSVFVRLNETSANNKCNYKEDVKTVYYRDNHFNYTDKEVYEAMLRMLGLHNREIIKIRDTVQKEQRQQSLQSQKEMKLQESIVSAKEIFLQEVENGFNDTNRFIEMAEQTLLSTPETKEYKIKLLYQIISAKKAVAAELETNLKQTRYDLERERKILTIMQKEFCSRERAISIIKEEK